ncbi:hypothetical protein R1sor_006148 [Riccia sorocarpa]|uniref:Uncharacterized protein n=1 Tax=Riccia sorocarpa TaxID=122646 RepID=A0ABD3HPI8_9MARC
MDSTYMWTSQRPNAFQLIPYPLRYLLKLQRYGASASGSQYIHVDIIRETLNSLRSLDITKLELMLERWWSDDKLPRFARNSESGIRTCLRNNLRADSSGRDGETSGSERKSQQEKAEPLWLRAAVSGVTELLRVFTTEGSSHAQSATTENSAFRIEEIVDGLREDYMRAYFLTGEFLESIYTEDCVFADPTIQFSGRELYKRNLKLLVPFFEDPSLTLECINQVENGGSRFIETTWKLRVYLKLPWKPFISVDGRTKYSLNANNKIVEHVESWNVTGFEAVGQIFKASERAFWKES